MSEPGYADHASCPSCGAAMRGPRAYGECNRCRSGFVEVAHEVVGVPDLFKEEDRRAMWQMPDSAAVAPQEGSRVVNINSAFKSNYLKHSDLNGKHVIVTMERVEVEEIGQGADKEEKPVLYFRGHDRGLVLNRTNANSIVEIVGSDDTDDWSEQRIVLRPDKTDFGGKRVDCIRVAAPPQGNVRKAAPKPPPEPTEISDGFQASDEDVPF